MKRIVFYLMGLLLFACSNAPMINTPIEAEEQWIYGTYTSKGERYIESEGENSFHPYNNASSFWEAIVYKRENENFIQPLYLDIPPLRFDNNQAVYEDSIVNILVEKNGGKFYVEFTAPKHYGNLGGHEEFKKNTLGLLQRITTKEFLYLK